MTTAAGTTVSMAMATTTPSVASVASVATPVDEIFSLDYKAVSQYLNEKLNKEIKPEIVKSYDWEGLTKDYEKLSKFCQEYEKLTPPYDVSAIIARGLTHVEAVYNSARRLYDSVHRMSRIEKTVWKPKNITLASLEKQLAGFAKEHPRSMWDVKNRCIRVVLGPFTLEDKSMPDCPYAVNMGLYTANIYLDVMLSDLANATNGGSPEWIIIKPYKNNPPCTPRPGTIHPHVRNGTVCFGDGLTALRNSAKTFDLSSVVDIIIGVMSGYMPGHYADLWMFIPQDQCKACNAPILKATGDANSVISRLVAKNRISVAREIIASDGSALCTTCAVRSTRFPDRYVSRKDTKRCEYIRQSYHPDDLEKCNSCNKLVSYAYVCGHFGICSACVDRIRETAAEDTYWKRLNEEIVPKLAEAAQKAKNEREKARGGKKPRKLRYVSRRSAINDLCTATFSKEERDYAFIRYVIEHGRGHMWMNGDHYSHTDAYRVHLLQPVWDAQAAAAAGTNTTNTTDAAGAAGAAVTKDGVVFSVENENDDDPTEGKLSVDMAAVATVATERFGG